MNALHTRLRRIFITWLIPLLILGGSAWAVAPDPVPVTPMWYGIKTGFIVLMLVMVPVTSIYFTRSVKKLREQEETIKVDRFFKVYRIRLSALAIMAALSLQLWILSGDVAYGTVSGVLMILFGLMYPSMGFLSRELEWPAE